MQVQQALNNIMQEHTVLVVAHRLSTVEKANSIIVIDRGQVVEQGTHSELMTRGGLYNQLVQRQILGLQTEEEFSKPSDVLSWRSEEDFQRRRKTSSTSESEGNVRY